MPIDLVPDRARRRPDPVEAADGVFATLAPEEMSVAEQARLAKVVPEAPDKPIPAEIPTQADPETPPKQWSPKAIVKRLTNLYAMFTRQEKNHG